MFPSLVDERLQEQLWSHLLLLSFCCFLSPLQAWAGLCIKRCSVYFRRQRTQKTKSFCPRIKGFCSVSYLLRSVFGCLMAPPFKGPALSLSTRWRWKVWVASDFLFCLAGMKAYLNSTLYPSTVFFVGSRTCSLHQGLKIKRFAKKTKSSFLYCFWTKTLPTHAFLWLLGRVPTVFLTSVNNLLKLEDMNPKLMLFLG